MNLENVVEKDENGLQQKQNNISIIGRNMNRKGPNKTKYVVNQVYQNRL